MFSVSPLIERVHPRVRPGLQRGFLGLSLATALYAPLTGHAATQYVYDELNRLTRVVYDSGQSITYSYDAAGILLQTQKSVPALCGQALDFAGNRLPPGWTVGMVRSGPGVVEQALQGWPVDSGAEVISPLGAFAANTQAVLVRFKVDTAYSYWGQTLGVGLQLDSGRVLQFAVNHARYNWGDGNAVFSLTDALGVWSSLSEGLVLATPVVKPGYRHGRQEVEFRFTGERFTATLKNLDAPAIPDVVHTFALPAGYGIQRMRRVTSWVYTTTDGSISADDIAVSCEGP